MMKIKMMAPQEWATMRRNAREGGATPSSGAGAANEAVRPQKPPIIDRDAGPTA